MRATLALLVLLAPVALAQAPPVELATLEIRPLSAPIAPLEDVLSTTMTLRASCALAEPTGIPVALAVTSPAWTTALVSPATIVLPLDACQDGWAEGEATLTVSATDQAPAFTPAALVVEAVAGEGERTARASDAIDVTASYFSILDAQIATSLLHVAPGGAADASVKLTNFGNGLTRVAFSMAQAPPTLEVALPEPIVLQSKQEGGNAISADVPIVVRAPPEEGVVNRQETVSIRVSAAYAEDGAFQGDQSTISWVVVIRALPESATRAAAIPGLAPLALVAVLALSARAFRR